MCLPSQFKCPTSANKQAFCIEKRDQCDGVPNCPNGEDENDCAADTCQDTFKCNNSKCIPYIWLCDGEEDCLDGYDEDKDFCQQRNCTADEFR